MNSGLSVGKIKLEIAKLLSESIESFVVWKGIDRIDNDEGDLDCFIDPKKIDLAVQTVNNYLLQNEIRTNTVLCRHIQGTAIYCIAYGNPFIEFDFTSFTTTLGGHRGTDWNFMSKSPKKTNFGITVADPQKSAIVKFLLDLDHRRLEFNNPKQIRIDDIEFSKKDFKKFLNYICPTLTQNLILFLCFQPKNRLTNSNFKLLKVYLRILILCSPIQLISRLNNRRNMRKCLTIQSIINGSRELGMLVKTITHERFHDELFEIGP